MKFGIYAPVPHVTINSKEMRDAAKGAAHGLGEKEVDPGFLLSRDIVKIADESGFDICLVAERHLGPDLEAWIHASALTAYTENITLMPAFHPGLWHPVMLAKLSVSLDRLSKGRMALNLVPGWWEEEHNMFGGSLLQGTDERYVKAEEFADILRGVWSSPDKFSYNGQVFQIDNAELLLQPASAKPPEIFVATGSGRGLEMAARIADWWFVTYSRDAGGFEGTLKSVEEPIRDMNVRSQKYGRQVNYAVNAFVLVDDTDEKAEKRAKKLLDEEVNEKFAAIQASSMAVGLIGSAETIAERIKMYEEKGVGLILMKFYPTREDMERIGKEVLPKVKSLEITR